MEIKDNNFETIYLTKSDEHGDYKIDLPAGIYPFVTAVRDYGEKYLEYWCSNLKLIHDAELNICIDTLEVYGLNYFKVAGAYPSITVYFRPMSLPKFLAQAGDIAPEINTIQAVVDGKALSVLTVNRVKEYVGDGSMSAYLIQIAEPEDGPNWNRLDLEIIDCDGNYGAASVYHC